MSKQKYKVIVTRSTEPKTREDEARIQAAANVLYTIMSRGLKNVTTNDNSINTSSKHSVHDGMGC